MKISVLILSLCFSLSCKSLSQSQNDSNLASATPPKTGVRTGKISSSRVFTDSTPNFNNTLSLKIWTHLRDMYKKNPKLVGCEESLGAKPTVTCTSYDTNTRADFLYCFAQSDSSSKFVATKIDNVSCDFVSSQWPKVSDYLVKNVLKDLLDKNLSGTKATIGAKKKIHCDSTSGTWVCQYDGFDKVTDFAAKRIVIRPKITGDRKPPAGSKDEHGNPLPSSSSQSSMQIGKENVQFAKFSANASYVKKYLDYLPDTDEPDYLNHIKDKGFTSNCSPGETFSLLDYSGGGYVDTNKTLRTLFKEPSSSATVMQLNSDEVLMSRLYTTISAVNCTKKIKSGSVVRGANLTSEQLKKYQKDAFVIEPSFTSTSVGDSVNEMFVGTVEFQYFDAVGADLTDLSLRAEDGERELLFQAGSVFKVLDNFDEGGQKIIQLLYIP